jgi:hypothetical protein
MFIFTIEDIIGLSLFGLFALGLLAIYVESMINKYRHKKRIQKLQQKGDL